MDEKNENQPIFKQQNSAAIDGNNNDFVPVQSLELTSVIGQIQQVLNDLQPYVSSHGGRIEFVELKDLVVFIRFYGACLQCPLSFYTLTYGVERHIKAKIPSILRVEALE